MDKERLFQGSALCGIRFTCLFKLFLEKYFFFQCGKIKHNVKFSLFYVRDLHFADQFGHLTKRVVFFLYLVFGLKMNGSRIVLVLLLGIFQVCIW